jgi:hypothetical protein
MIGWLADRAYRLDAWLQTRLGRPYSALLSVGLIIEIVRGMMAFPEHLAARATLIGRALVLLMEAALLVHQVGNLSHHLPRRARRRDGGGAGGADGAAAVAAPVSEGGENEGGL